MTHYLKGVHAALAKLGGQRVDVTEDETYQYRPEPAYINDTRLRGRNIESSWDVHDRRMDLMGRDFPLVGS